MRCPELRVEVPHSVADPFLYVERDGDRYAVVRSLEAARMSEIEGMTVLPLESLGLDEHVANGLDSDAAMLEIAARACAELGVRKAVVPAGFPLEVADRLRADGVVLDVDRAVFTARRRSKTARQLEGIRRAQVAAEAGTRAAAELLRAADDIDDVLHLEGEPLTSERLKQAVAEAFLVNGATAEDFIVARGEQTCIGHHMGSGPILVGEPITVDLWPRDVDSGFHTDMTRTFVVGTPPDELVEYHRLVKEALDKSLEATKAGVPGVDIFTLVCEHFEAAGQPTVLSKKPGQVLEDGFFHGLGHGIGLEVHEAPNLGRGGTAELLPGDVVTLEPGLYRQGFGGCRLEDLVVVTENGAENLTNFPYDLTP